MGLPGARAVGGPINWNRHRSGKYRLLKGRERQLLSNIAAAVSFPPPSPSLHYSPMESLVRRLKSESVLGERQLDHVVTLLQEYSLFSSLYW